MHKKLPYRSLLVVAMLLSAVLLHAGKSTTCCKRLNATVVKPVETVVVTTAAKTAEAILPSIIIF